MAWSDDWIPSARSSLVTLRGTAGDDAGGHPLPALSVTDAISVLAQMTGGIIGQLSRLATSGAVRADYVDTEGVFSAGQLQGMDPGSALTLAQYLSAYPPPPQVNATGAWLRSPTDYSAASESGIVDDAAIATAWASATTGGSTGDAAAYTIYTTDQYDATGQLMSCRQLVDDYQHACDAIATGAATQADMTQTMSVAALAALWVALDKVAADLDTLSDVPPRPATVEVLQQAADAAATEIGKAAAQVANVAGRTAGEAVKGFGQGIGLPGLAAIVGVLVIAMAVR